MRTNKTILPAVLWEFTTSKYEGRAQENIWT